MEKTKAASEITSRTVVRSTASKPSSMINFDQFDGSQTGKCVTKLTAKALVNKIDSLQNERKSMLNKAVRIRGSLQSLMKRGKIAQVHGTLDELIHLSDNVKCVNDSLLVLLPVEESEKHEIWFNAKMLSINECISEVKTWVLCNAPENGNIDDDICPDDSVSNVESTVNTLITEA